MDTSQCSKGSPRRRCLLLLLSFAVPVILLIMWMNRRHEGVDITGLGGVLDEIKH